MYSSCRGFERLGCAGIATRLLQRMGSATSHRPLHDVLDMPDDGADDTTTVVF